MSKPPWKAVFAWTPWALPWVLLSYGAVGAATAGVLVLFAGAMLHHAITPDFPWLWVTGQHLLSYGALPQTDLYSWTMPEKPWVLYQWAFEAALAWKGNLMGIPYLVRAFVLWAVGFYVLIPLLKDGKRRIPAGITLGVACLALMTTPINLSLRPMMVTVYFLALQYGLIHSLKSQRLSFRWSAVGLGLVYLMWGNMHTGVVIGLASLGVFMAGDWLEASGRYAYRPEIAGFDHRPLFWRTWLVLIAVAIGGSLINPYGWEIYTYLATLSGQAYLNAAIQELQSPNFHLPGYQCFLVLWVLFLAVLPRARQALPASAVLHLAVFTLAMLFVQRFVVWTALFYAWMLPQGLYLAWQAYVPAGLKRWHLGLEVLRPSLVTAILLAGVVFVWQPQIFNAPPVRMSSCEGFKKALDTYQAIKHPSDKIFHDAEIGSCILLYHPAQKVFIDTRFDFYGGELMQESREVQALAIDPEPMLQKRGITTLLLKPQIPLSWYLRGNPGYQVLYEDSALIIFRRTGETPSQ